jgi:hypothetical protein
MSKDLTRAIKVQTFVAHYLKLLEVKAAAEATGISTQVATSYLEEPDVLNLINRLVTDRLRRMYISADGVLADLYEKARAATPEDAAPLFRLVMQHMNMLPNPHNPSQAVPNISFNFGSPKAALPDASITAEFKEVNADLEPA